MPNLGQDKEKLKKIDFLFLVPHFLPRNKKSKKTKKQEFLVSVAIHISDPQCLTVSYCRETLYCCDTSNSTHHLLLECLVITIFLERIGHFNFRHLCWWMRERELRYVVGTCKVYPTFLSETLYNDVPAM